MSVLIQLSDLHFGTERTHVVEALIRFVAAQQPELVIVSGDITQRARRSQFAAARTFVDRLARPTLVLAGNHDIPLFNLFARSLHPYANFSRAFGADREPTFDSAGLHVTCIDSTTPRRHKDGEIDDTQIRRVSARLRSAGTDRLRIVCLHHPVHAITESDRANLARGHREAVPAWAEAGVDLILGGHIHLPYVRPLREHFPHLARDAWAVQAGTAVSHRVRGGIANSVNLIRYEAGAVRPECRVERWDHDDAAGEFTRVLDTPILLDRIASPAPVESAARAAMDASAHDSTAAAKAGSTLP
jgi:3',5'-cyclic AMP phosphodiesterase CpdA